MNAVSCYTIASGNLDETMFNISVFVVLSHLLGEFSPFWCRWLQSCVKLLNWRSVTALIDCDKAPFIPSAIPWRSSESAPSYMNPTSLYTIDCGNFISNTAVNILFRVSNVKLLKFSVVLCARCWLRDPKLQCSRRVIEVTRRDSATLTFSAIPTRSNESAPNSK